MTNRIEKLLGFYFAAKVQAGQDFTLKDVSRVCWHFGADRSRVHLEIVKRLTDDALFGSLFCKQEIPYKESYKEIYHLNNIRLQRYTVYDEKLGVYFVTKRGWLRVLMLLPKNIRWFRMYQNNRLNKNN